MALIAWGLRQVSKSSEDRNRQLDIMDARQEAQSQALERQGRALEELLRRSAGEPPLPGYRREKARTWRVGEEAATELGRAGFSGRPVRQKRPSLRLIKTIYDKLGRLSDLAVFSVPLFFVPAPITPARR